MHIRRAVINLIILFSMFHAHAQKVNNVWAFGKGSGLNFNTDPVSFRKSKTEGMEPPYFTTSICDKDGNLKFYTDGINVWNRDHFLMPKYNNWWPWSGEPTDTVMPLICPYPGPAGDSLYYLFGISSGLNANKLLYLTIRMNEAGDLEEVVYPRPASRTSYYKSLIDNASLLLAGTAHCNQKDVWIVTHTPGALNSFLITKDGVSTTPVVSSVPATVLPATNIDGQYGNIKFAASGERAAIPLAREQKVAVLDFDNLSGRFSNPFTLSLPESYLLEDVELSPDGNKLYVSAFYNIEIVGESITPSVHQIFQYDLNAGSISEIDQTRFSVNGFGDRVACSPRICYFMKRTMQLGPDGKIYASMRYGGAKLDMTISVIEDPNKSREDARYRRNLVKLDSVARFINYNYIRSGSYSLRENGIQTQKTNCSDQPVSFSLLYSRVDSVKWDFGDPASGSANFSASLAPQHQYPKPGTYTAKAIIYIRCYTDTATRQVVIRPDKSVKVPDHIRDTFECIGNQLILDARTEGATSYTWDNGLIYSYRTLDTPGRYTITVYNDCSMDRRSFNYRYDECPCEVFTPNAFTPNNDGLNDNFHPVVKCSAKDYQFRIYNRYGGLTFQSSEINKGWNGKAGIQESPSGMYLWSVQYRNPNTKELFVKHGTVMLIR